MSICSAWISLSFLVDQVLSPTLFGVDGSPGDPQSTGQSVGPQSDGHMGGALSPGQQQCPGAQRRSLPPDVPRPQYTLPEHLQTNQKSPQPS